MNNPKVSVIIPVYNTEAYVEQTLRSIMGQTLRDIELIVVNDGSTDGSLSVLERIANCHSHEDRKSVVGVTIAIVTPTKIGRASWE